MTSVELGHFGSRPPRLHQGGGLRRQDVRGAAPKQVHRHGDPAIAVPCRQGLGRRGGLEGDPRVAVQGQPPVRAAPDRGAGHPPPEAVGRGAEGAIDRPQRCEARSSATEAAASVIMAKWIALTRSDSRPLAVTSTRGRAMSAEDHRVPARAHPFRQDRRPVGAEAEERCVGKADDAGLADQQVIAAHQHDEGAYPFCHHERADILQQERTEEKRGADDARNQLDRASAQRGGGADRAAVNVVSVMAFPSLGHRAQAVRLP